jgi:hypothetical protein
MTHLLTTNHQPLTTSQQRLACELSGLPPADLLKVRATNDSLVVIIHTGQKFIYDLAAIQAAVERLAAGLGRFTDDYFRDTTPETQGLPMPMADVEPAPLETPLQASAGPAKAKTRAGKRKPK